MNYLQIVELSVGMQTEGVEIRSVGNTLVSSVNIIISSNLYLSITMCRFFKKLPW